jgi:hypothetical protein
MASDIYYGLSAREVRKFSFQYAMALNINILEGWRDTKIAGIEWFQSSSKGVRLIHCANLRQQASAELSKTDVNAFLL